jgi:hypothetical protein
MRRMTVVLAFVLILGGCTGDDAGSEGSSAAPPDDAVVVLGTEYCSLRNASDETIDGVAVLNEEFVCELDMSDPRVSGTETLQVVSRIDWDVGGPWTADGRIVTDDGEWVGTGQGVVDMVGHLPYAEGRNPANFGEMRYEGTGDLEGLTFTYYFAGSDDTVGIAGWLTDDT